MNNGAIRLDFDGFEQKYIIESDIDSMFDIYLPLFCNDNDKNVIIYLNQQKYQTNTQILLSFDNHKYNVNNCYVLIKHFMIVANKYYYFYIENMNNHKFNNDNVNQKLVSHFKNIPYPWPTPQYQATFIGKDIHTQGLYYISPFFFSFLFFSFFFFFCFSFLKKTNKIKQEIGKINMAAMDIIC